ncbi:MAG: lamin tail domain-containing protein [Gammaproteobacteria bacterium]|nr:MAG: lamin tail domain-containing protein [Gammaproteobacteria bacterium]
MKQVCMTLLTTASIVITLLTSSIVSAAIVINEFLPDPSGTDSGNEWIELYNNGTSTVNIDSWAIDAGTSSFSTIFTFSSTSLLSGDYLVIGESNVSGADLTATLGLGNATATGDGLRLIDNAAVVIDTVIYGPNNNDNFIDDTAGIASSLAPSPTTGLTLGRLPNGVDTDASAIDFSVLASPSLGVSNSVVPLPPTVWLFGSGLLGLIGIARRKKAA